MKFRHLHQVFLAGFMASTPLISHGSLSVGATENLREPTTFERMASATVPFIKNHGQISKGDVQFYARTLAGTLFVTEQNHLVYSLPQKNPKDQGARWAFREVFSGSQSSTARGNTISPVLVSHFKGENQENWKSSIETFDSVDLGELFPHIRVTLKASGNNVEKLFHVEPGGDVKKIKVAVEGVNDIAINHRDQLVLTTSIGDIVFTAPIAYQVVDGLQQPVDVAYVIGKDQQYGFSVGEYDRRTELVIDPLLASTYVGGHNANPPGNYDDDIVYGMAAAETGIYIAGATQSPDFPIHLGYDETLENAYPDGFITFMTSDLSQVIASTFFGTEGFDRVTDIAIDDAGMVVVVGQAGYGFPLTEGAYNWNGISSAGGGFVAKFSPDLTTLEASALVTPVDYPSAIALGNGQIYFGGSTNNPDFPISNNAYLASCCQMGAFGIREYDGFGGALSSDLSTLEAMSYLGGQGVSGISVAPDGGVFITDGFDHAVTGYLARFDQELTTRSAILSYYPGSNSGSSRTYFNDVIAEDGFVVVTGQTYMNDLPATDGAFDTTCGTDGLCDGTGSLIVPRSDGFVAIYGDDLQSTIALTYLGGSDHESVRSVALGPGGSIIVTGETSSVDFPTTDDAADTDCGSDGFCDPTGVFFTPTADGYVARFSADLSLIEYSTYLGGSGEDRPTVVTVDGDGMVYAAGYTRSLDFPTTEAAFDPTYNGGTSDAFISKIDSRSTDLIFADDFESGGMYRWSEN